MRTTNSLSRPFALGFALALASCSIVPEKLKPLTAPAVDVVTRHWAGSPLTGPGEITPVIDPDAPVVTCRLLYLDHLPETLLAPLVERARLIASASGSSAIQATTDVHQKTRIGTGSIAVQFLDDLGGLFGLGRVVGLGGLFGIRVLKLDEMSGIVIPGATTSFTLTAVDPINHPVLGRTRGRLSVLVTRSDPRTPRAIQIAIIHQNILARTGDSTAQGNPPALRTEVVVLDVSPEVGGTPIVLAAPTPFPGDAKRAFALVLEFKSKRDTGSAYTGLVAQCRENLDTTTTSAALGARNIDANSERWRELQVTFKALQFARTHRGTLLHLASSTGARLASDLALSADEEHLAAFVKQLLSLDDPMRTSSPEKLGWTLEKTAFLLLADLLDREKIEPVFAGMFARHAGEAARFPGTMHSILNGCPDMATLNARLLAENRLFLEDARPSARVRAFDWLKLRNATPPNFDPLASRDARRKALVAVEAVR